MRAATLICFAFLGCNAAYGQDQERKLLDRLLKPDMALQNSAQEKKFVARGATTEKQTRTKSFYTPERPLPKQFEATQAFATQQVRTRVSRYDRQEAILTPRNPITNAEVAYATSGYNAVHAAPDAAKSIPPRAFSGERAFAGRGKSQKALSAQDRPLTIDQVRELLNKNK